MQLFAQVMTLMRMSGVELSDPNLLRPLLRFVVLVECADYRRSKIAGASGGDFDIASSNSTTLERLLAKLSKDKNIPITHIECNALSILLYHRRMGNFEFVVSLARPFYQSADYLIMHPDTVGKVR